MGIDNFIGNSADIALIIRQQLLNLLSERKSSKWCSEVAKKYIKSQRRNKTSKVIDEINLIIALRILLMKLLFILF